MSNRFERDRAEVAQYLPSNTRYVPADGRDIWLFQKKTELGITFQIALYYDPDESTPGYCAQVVSPPIEDTWKNPHLGHLWSDGVICLGRSSMRTGRSIREAYSKSCLWAEGMAAMIQSHLAGLPSAFPFSNNNSDAEVA